MLQKKITAEDPLNGIRPETLERINKLLVKHEWKGTERGLFSIEDLSLVRDKFIELAGWLAENPPAFMGKAFDPSHRFDENTVLSIAYPDHVRCENGTKPALALQKFFNGHFKGLYSHLHILPHFRSPKLHEDLALYGPAGRADGGFEAMDYKMDPDYGTPDDLRAIEAELMFDFVVNHLSVHGPWFEKFLEDEPGYEDFFVTVPEEQMEELDLSPVFRPREHYPIIEFTNKKGKTKHVWCTFSPTQADLNVKNPQVFCTLLEALIKDFIGEGASWIRLDAVGYLVKMLGLDGKEALTSSFGLKETHNILKALNIYFADIAPQVTLVPEVNATGKVIDTYYGEHDDEGHLVYDFPSAPFSLYAIYREDASVALKWAHHRTLRPDWIGLAFTNSHDGIGVLSMADVPNIHDSQTALDFFLHQLERRGAGINYKSKIINGESVRVPYEACIAWLQAILSPAEAAALRGDRLEDGSLEEVVNRFMASQSFIYSGPHCVPADYLGVSTGLLNDEALYEIAGHRRNKNRGVINAQEFERAIANPQTDYDHVRKCIFDRKKDMILARQKYKAFSPYARCDVDVVTVPDAPAETKPVFSVLRHDPAGKYAILCLTNCAEKSQKMMIHSNYFSMLSGRKLKNILNGDRMLEWSEGGTSLTLDPYQVAWLYVDLK